MGRYGRKAGEPSAAAVAATKRRQALVCSGRDRHAWEVNAREGNAWTVNAREVNAQVVNARVVNAREVNARVVNATMVHVLVANAWVDDVQARGNGWAVRHMHVTSVPCHMQCNLGTLIAGAERSSALV